MRKEKGAADPNNPSADEKTEGVKKVFFTTAHPLGGKTPRLDMFRDGGAS